MMIMAMITGMMTMTSSITSTCTSAATAVVAADGAERCHGLGRHRRHVRGCTSDRVRDRRRLRWLRFTKGWVGTPWVYKYANI